MTSLKRTLAGLVLGFYLAMIGIQTFHTHTATAEAHAQCQICKIAHQSPSLINPPVVPRAPVVFATAVILEIPGSALQIVFRSYGPSPPTA
jgi:hypothetical protein